jgi:E3 ubiquitin-protein ligase Topors
METSGTNESSCLITDITPQITTFNEVIINPEVVLESSSDNSEVEFVLALKPPHLRTPEMVSLESASDSDVVFVPNDPVVVTRVDSSTTDSDDNKPLAETVKQLKTESDESKVEISKYVEAILNSNISPENPNLDKPHDSININNMDDNVFNYGASTSNTNININNNSNSNSNSNSNVLGVNATELDNKLKKIYFAPKRKNISKKSIFESSSSSASSKSGSSSDSSSTTSSSNSTEWNKKDIKSKSRRKHAAKRLKIMRKSSAINQKPLNKLHSSEETHNSDEEQMPRIKSVIIKKNDNQHYTLQNKPSNSDASFSSN